MQNEDNISYNMSTNFSISADKINTMIQYGICICGIIFTGPEEGINAQNNFIKTVITL